MESLHIRGLTVENIGPFGSLDLNFPPKPSGMEDRAEVHILTGENGSGKTTVLEALATSMHRILNQFFPQKRRKDFLKNILSVRFNEGESNSLVFENGTTQIFFHNNRVQDYWHASRNYQQSKFSTAFFAYSGYRRVGHVKVSAIQELQNHPFEYALDFQNSIHPQQILQWVANTISKEAIEKSQGRADKAKRFRNSIEMEIRQVNRRLGLQLSL